MRLTSFVKDFQKGFTLIELMVVLSVTAILGTIGIAGFSNFNKIQIRQTAAGELTNTLITARSRALSQIKLPEDSICNASGLEKKLEGYSVNLSIEGKNYTLQSHCSDFSNPTYPFIGKVIYTKQLPEGIKFGDMDVTSFFFPVLTGKTNLIGDVQIFIEDEGESGANSRVIVTPLGGIRQE